MKKGLLGLFPFYDQIDKSISLNVLNVFLSYKNLLEKKNLVC